MLARDAEMTVLDFETTGSVEGYPVEAWQLGMVRIRGGRIDAQPVFNQLLHVGDRPFNPHAPGKHHQLRKELQQAPNLMELWGTIKLWWIGVPLVAHNTGTEQKFVKQTAPVHRIGPWVDTLKLARLAYPRLPSHGLDQVIASLGLMAELKQYTGDLEAHDALYDAFASAVLLLHVLDLPGWEAVTIDDLARAKPHDYYRNKS